MKEKFYHLPKPFQKQMLIQLAAGAAFLLLMIAIFICFRDLYFTLPCVLMSAYLMINGGRLFYNGYRGNYVCIRGKCEEIESVGIRKRIKSIRIVFDGYSVKIPIRQRMKRITVGDTVIVYLSEKAPVYERNGEYMIGSYDVLETERGCNQNESRSRGVEIPAERNRDSDS